MRALSRIRDRIRRKGLRDTLKAACRRLLFHHRQLLWTERDLFAPLPPHRLRRYGALRVQTITVINLQALNRHFAHRIEVLRDLVAEGYTGLMAVDDQGDAVGFIWGSTRHYHDRHYYGCWFPVGPGEYFQFGGEMIRKYWGTQLSADVQQALWKVMAAQGCNKVVDVCEHDNIPALKLHLRMGYREQGRIMNVYCLFGRWKFFRESRYSGSRLGTLKKKPAARRTPVVES